MAKQKDKKNQKIKSRIVLMSEILAHPAHSLDPKDYLPADEDEEKEDDGENQES